MSKVHLCTLTLYFISRKKFQKVGNYENLTSGDLHSFEDIYVIDFPSLRRD